MKAEWTIRAAESRMKVVIMVSKMSHCLADLLWRWRSGELDCDIPLVISNHEDLRQMVEREGLEFCHIPVTPGKQAGSLPEIGERLRALQPQLIVLARYMQIIPSELCRRVLWPDDQHSSLLFAVIRRRESVSARLRTSAPRVIMRAPSSMRGRSSIRK